MNVERMKSWQYFNFAIPLQTQYLSSQKRSSHSLNQLATTSYTLKDFFFQTCFHIFYFAFILRDQCSFGWLDLTYFPPSLSLSFCFFLWFICRYLRCHSFLQLIQNVNWFSRFTPIAILPQMGGCYISNISSILYIPCPW